MGFVEVLLNLWTIIRNISFCKKDILQFQPDVIILVDYPGFNLRIAEFAKKNSFKVVYYISPQVWAWKKSRVHTIKKVVDKMLVILPFEEDFFKKYDVKVDFVGHPLLDAINKDASCNKEEFIKKNLLPRKPIIALLPGSRKQEVKKMLQQMLKVVSHFDKFQFVVAGVDSISKEVYAEILKNSTANVVFNQTHDLLHFAEAALVTSGTATLETALLEVPEVVCYKGNWLSYEIAKRIIDVKFISLVNLIMDRLVVKELIQNDLNEKNLIYELSILIDDDATNKRLKYDYSELKNKLGLSGASANAAKIIDRFLTGEN
jgi:lipid-A-disaccharide synthase